MQAYSDPTRETDPHALPDLEIFQLTAFEVAESEMYEEEQYEYLKRYPLATMNSRDRDNMLEAMVDELGIEGGWYYWFCFPGCLPDSSPFGPFDSAEAAIFQAEATA